jgi:hypothetical protein
MDDRWLVSGAVDAFHSPQHAKGAGVEAHPRVGGRIYSARQEVYESEDRHRPAKKEEPKRETPTTTYMCEMGTICEEQ